MNPMIEINDICQAFRTGFWMQRVQILKQVTFSVPKGAIFGFLGANGAGKTTLIHLIAGIRRPVSGRITVDGIPSLLPEARAKIGYLPERPYFHEHVTGEGLLTYFGSLSMMSSEQIRQRIPMVLEEVGMTHAAKLELKNYSKGMLQRIGIAQALIHNPELLILDEPMSGLDPVGRKEVRELILKLSEAGKTIFFSSHVIPDVEAICTRVALIEKGRIRGSGTVDELLTSVLGHKESRYEIEFSGLAKEQVTQIADIEEFKQSPDGFRAIAKDRPAAQSTLAHLLQQNAKVISFHPIRPSLEDLFKEEKRQ